MCGRYTYYSSEEILSIYGLEESPTLQLALEFADNYNVAPTTKMPVIVRGTQSHKVEMMQWGLIPSWSKSESSKYMLINARREGLYEKPIWKRLVRTRRCIVPARGFYEWKLVDGVKKPFYIYPTDKKIFSIAGLWDEWADQTGQILKSFTIITTEPNDKMSGVHDRMPAILTNQLVDIWLSATEIEREQADDILRCIGSDQISIHPVSTAVNKVGFNSKELIYPFAIP